MDSLETQLSALGDFGLQEVLDISKGFARVLRDASGELSDYKQSIQKRYGLFEHFENKQPPGQGWYCCTLGAVCELETSRHYAIHERVAHISGYWRRRLLAPHSDDKDIPVMVKFVHNEVIKQLWIEEVSGCKQGSQQLCVDVFAPGDLNLWVLRDSGNYFRVDLGFGVGAMQTLRGALLFQSFHPSLDFQNLCLPVLLDWISAAGDNNVLELVDDCLSKRRPQGAIERLSYTGARNLVRHARGIPALSEQSA